MLYRICWQRWLAKVYSYASKVAAQHGVAIVGGPGVVAVFLAPEAAPTAFWTRRHWPPSSNRRVNAKHEHHSDSKHSPYIDPPPPTRARYSVAIATGIVTSGIIAAKARTPASAMLGRSARG